MHVDQLSTDEPIFDPVGEAGELIEAGRALEVVARCAALLARGRGGILTRVALGRALVALGRAPEAVEGLREACHLSPNTAEVCLAFGEALAATGALPAAIAEFQRATRLAPDDGRPHWQIALLWLEAGEPGKAEIAAEVALKLDGASEASVAALRARADAMRHAARADAGYVRELFNQFSGDYDSRMQQQLGYAAPGILRGLAGMLVDPARKLDVLDLGCGTGLSGVAFNGLAKSLAGVDLSARMLDKARSLGIYGRLVEGDVESLPRELDGPFDLIIAADVLVYLGDLETLFSGVRARLNPGGLWLFTTERGETADFALGAKRRFQHSQIYLRALAARHKFEVSSLIECVSRYEAGQGVESLAAAFRLPHLA